ncbi:hypothetical protein O2F44_02100 [Lacticaseibacillus rhamnosus]|jgi:hypothetical protein|uniref:Uncharacterized protein n=1 Tax=Lacticaseibacillus rhamnosus (strain LMS2-1) TaxID=525361 RepID=C2JXT0_LACRM|nr:hypothetical protein [Lacticaseibacillus rhamnosus]AER64402.1 conserved hypothetical protein [Lacticaseibacillus rhamnosus ATCC 8530]AGP74331.1 Hypothetical protein LOCK908_1694 [Lacticaseibacillus rhamnosus LOCK908]EEN80168.1 hypothetical protein HMPREF0539_1715 [Lacticaseibacillus rhamnosus LMS2-1]MDU1359020.1 hypothetical protein [Citrobacter freundii]CAR90477.1 Conserved protein [Lacticaseibacillus rhamnosus Lc 705]
MQAKIAFLRDLSVNSPEKPLHVLLTRTCLLDEKKKGLEVILKAHFAVLERLQAK